MSIVTVQTLGSDIRLNLFSTMASSSMFPLNIISWAEALSGVPNHQVHYIPKDHPANPTSQGAPIIVKPSRKVPTHPRLVCIYKDEWTEVQWNAEAKTYTVGVSVTAKVLARNTRPSSA